jgi:hypothetical protein
MQEWHRLFLPGIESGTAAYEAITLSLKLGGGKLNHSQKKTNNKKTKDNKSWMTNKDNKTLKIFILRIELK